MLDEHAKVFLWNTMNKLDTRIQKITSDLEVVERGIAGMRILEDAYTNNEDTGDSSVVVEVCLSECL